MIYLLIGFIGSGKSSIGKILAEKTDCKFVELDSLILQNTGFSSIKEVYDYRESFWKETELETCQNLSKKEDFVISCSSSTTENQLNFLYFTENCKNLKIIYLKTETKILFERILKNQKNPIENEHLQERLEILQQEKSFLMEKIANKIILTDNLTMEEVVKQILKV
jgi:shikimate kinase